MASDGHGGKIDGKLKDRLPVIPDKIARKLDEGKDVPIEELVGEAAAEQMADRQAHRSDPVRMSDLTAVAKGDPRIAGHMDFANGATVPQVPQVRRVIPEPFRRPSIGLVANHGKSWQRVRARQVAIGDVVAEFGRVVVKREETRYESRASLLGQYALPLEPGDVVLPGELEMQVEVPDVPVAVGIDIILVNVAATEMCVDERHELRVFASEGAGEPDTRALRTF